MNQALLDEICGLVTSSIGTYTGPTGGWIGGPQQVKEEILNTLVERYEPEAITQEHAPKEGE